MTKKSYECECRYKTKKAMTRRADKPHFFGTELNAMA
jgi:hypothetical protein